ncbi:MAG: hypothetical protein RL299_2128 [Pseudomonadota bacterium]|jgi:phage tail P2-like protein
MLDIPLPQSSGRAEKALAAGALAASDIPITVDQLWNPLTCPAAVLPWLAWALSVDDWDQTWTEATQREVIAASFEVHRRKGTPAAIKAQLLAMGYGNATLIEDWQLPRLGSLVALLGGDDGLGGEWVLGPSDPNWADYWVEIMVPIRRRDADALAVRLASVAPARCRLRSITLTGAFYTIGDDLWVIGDDIALGNTYPYEV